MRHIKYVIFYWLIALLLVGCDNQQMSKEQLKASYFDSLNQLTWSYDYALSGKRDKDEFFAGLKNNIKQLQANIDQLKANQSNAELTGELIELNELIIKTIQYQFDRQGDGRQYSYQAGQKALRISEHYFDKQLPDSFKKMLGIA